MDKKTVVNQNENGIPSKCPVTGRSYFCEITHPADGKLPTYGGPFDSYSIPCAYPCDEFPEAKEFRCRHYDHDDGSWVDGTDGIDLFMVERETLIELYELRDLSESQAATIARLTAERDEAVRERDELRERIGSSYIPGFWYGPLDVVDGPHQSVKSIVDAGSGDALIANIYHDNPRCAESVRDLMSQAALAARPSSEENTDAVNAAGKVE